MVVASNVVPLSQAAQKPKISVIMVSFMTGPALMEAITAVMNDEDIFELIIVDNGNIPTTRVRLSQLCADYDRIRLLQGHGNIGFSKGCNYGAELASGDYFLFLNPDAVIAPGSARKMAEAGEGLQQPWATGGYLRDEYGREQKGARRGALTPWSAFVSFTGLHKLPFIQSIHLNDTHVPSQPTSVAVTSGACMMLDRKSFNMLNGFDPGYFFHVEDIDICHRIQMRGGEVYIVPSASVMHYGSTSNVPRLRVEYEKFKGFVRYFSHYKSKKISKPLTALATPFFFVAIMGRAGYLTLRFALIGR